MKRRYLCGVAVAFGAGILIFDALLYLFWIIFGILILSGGALLIRLKKIYIIVLSLMFLTGGLYGNYTQNAYKKSPLYEYTRKECSGKLFVTGIESKGDNYVMVSAKVTQIEDDPVSENILFTIYNINDVKVNTVIEFKELKFTLPYGQRNKGSFDYNRYLKSKGIYYTATSEREKLVAKGEDGFFVLKFCRNIKQNIQERCEEIFGESNAGKMLPALLVGNDSSLTNEIDDLFSAAGISHILVASGMHVTIILSICAVLFYPLRKHRKLYNILSALAVLLFAMIVGIHPSIIRAAITYFMYMFARNSLRSADSITILSVAMLVVFAINPLYIYNLSFLLSFGAVFGIITLSPHINHYIGKYIYPPRIVKRFPSWIRKATEALYRISIGAASVTIAVQIMVLPVLITTFNNVAMMTVFINVVIAFLSPFIYATGMVAVITGLEPFVSISKFACDALVWGAELTAKIPGNNLSLPSSELITAACCLFALSCFLRCKVKGFAKLFDAFVALCCILVLAGCALTAFVPKDKAVVTFLNVGQGDCTIIRLSGNKTVVIDTGTENMCSFEVVSYLERMGINKIDALILSHGDSDHSGGAQVLNSNVEIEKVITNAYYNPMLYGVKRNALEAGDEFEVGKARFTVLSPDSSANTDSNDSSLVIRMDFGESSFLFTGDAGVEVEEKLNNVDTDVLKVSHHGSSTASSEKFLDNVSPEFSVISVDKNNRYDHPDKDVLYRLIEKSGEVLMTSKDYTITITADLNGELELTKGI